MVHGGAGTWAPPPEQKTVWLSHIQCRFLKRGKHFDMLRYPACPSWSNSDFKRIGRNDKNTHRAYPDNFEWHLRFTANSADIAPPALQHWYAFRARPMSLCINNFARARAKMSPVILAEDIAWSFPQLSHVGVNLLTLTRIPTRKLFRYSAWKHPTARPKTRDKSLNFQQTAHITVIAYVGHTLCYLTVCRTCGRITCKVVWYSRSLTPGLFWPIASVDQQIQ